MSTNPHDLLAELDWDYSPTFDPQGRATLTAPDGRFATIALASVSGTPHQSTYNGFLVTVTSPTVGVIDRRTFEFTAYGLPASEMKLIRTSTGPAWRWWQGANPYTGRWDHGNPTADLCRAVEAYLELFDISSPVSLTPDVAWSTLVLRIGEGGEWRRLLNGLVTCIVTLTLHDGWPTTPNGKVTIRFDGVRDGDGGEVVFGRLLKDGDTEADPAFPELEFPIESIMEVQYL